MSVARRYGSDGVELMSRVGMAFVFEVKMSFYFEGPHSINQSRTQLNLPVVCFTATLACLFFISTYK